MEKVSVIVPVYNAEAYLEQCVDSIIKQSYTNLEIILVNDGSLDRSREICDRYQQQDNRVKVLHKLNEGVAATRNKALELVTGEYIVFVDCDDWLEESHIKDLYDLLHATQSDIAIGNFIQYMEDTKLYHFHVPQDQYFEQEYTIFEWFKKQYDSQYNFSQVFTVPWAKLYKSTLFDTIAYPSDKKVEDDYTTYKVYLKANKIVYMNKGIYVHRKRDTSVTRKVNLSHVYPLSSIEERVMLLLLANAPQELIELEKKAYEWRLGIHKETYFNEKDTEQYKNTITKFMIGHRVYDNQQMPEVSVLTVTNSQDIEKIEELACALPQVIFHIAAHTAMGEKLLMLTNYANVILHQNSSQEDINELIKRTNIYLDINMGGPVSGVLESVKQQNIPIFGFYKTQNGPNGQFLFSSERYLELVDAIKKYSQIGELPIIEPLPLVRTVDETLDYLLTHKDASVARFGDGEINIINGHSIAYQDYNPQLAQEMREILRQQSNELLVVCLHNQFDDAKFEFTEDAELFWKTHLNYHDNLYRKLCPGTWYGTTTISRPYMGLIDKSKSEGYFNKLKLLWDEKDILIVEGATTRAGSGNDLFANAKSISRIICSSHNAYHRVDEIELAIRQYGKNKLILVMLGPTAKVLVHRLYKDGYRLLDIGHIDSEYEWFKMQATTKVKFNHKHTAEHNFDQNIEFIEDPIYNSQIVVDLSSL